jgi:nitrate reductase molybdenum cofactor assembly chaperone NarJ/NarW
MRNAYEFFAELLDYPGPTTEENTRKCIALVAPASAEAAEKVRQFEAGCVARSLTQIQELYTKSFDLRPDCTLNTSYHLFGDDWRRSIFLAELKGIYNSCSFETGNELPDYLCLILRFLGTKERSGQTGELVEECVIPAVRHILLLIGQEENPYKEVLEALLLWLTASGNLASAASEGENAMRVASGN